MIPLITLFVLTKISESSDNRSYCQVTISSAHVFTLSLRLLRELQSAQGERRESVRGSGGWAQQRVAPLCVSCSLIGQ